MWERVLIMLCFLQVRSLEIGEPCKTTDNLSGTCKRFNDCQHAQIQVRNLRQPTRCGFQGTFTLAGLVVCCPESQDHMAGQLRMFFDESTGPILYSPNLTLRYDGDMPALVCEKVTEVLPEPEDPRCPPLELEKYKIDPNDIAMKKCLEYQHFANPCLQDASLNYYRDNKCSSDDLNRIAGGTPANGTMFPHMALLGCRNIVNNETAYIQWVAGGALISDRFILTAGHVLSHVHYRTIRYALMGVTDKKQAIDGILYHIVRRLPHKLYAPPSKVNDIALLELDRRVEFSDFIRPACLPSPTLKIKSSNRIIAGWGQTSSFDKTPSEILMMGHIKELDYETQCKPKLSKEREMYVEGKMICAGSSTNATVDTCQGDSGGPLIAVAEDLFCTFVIRGVVSFGPGCSSGLPGFYTNVSAYLPWIVETVWGKVPLR